MDRIAQKIDSVDPWSFSRLLEYMRDRFVLQKPELQRDFLPFFHFLGELKGRMEKLKPDSRKGLQCAELCLDFAASDIHEIENLLATVVLESLLAGSDSWRRFFYARWADHPNERVRANLAFATCFTALEDKQDLLLRMAEDSNEFVRACVLQSLWYGDAPFPAEHVPVVREILAKATAGGGELVERFAHDIRPRLQT